VTSASTSLNDLARAYGVSTSFENWRDEEVPASEEAIRDVLIAMGVDPSNPAEALAERELEPWRRTLPHCVVTIEGDSGTVSAHIAADDMVTATLTLETGRVLELSISNRGGDTERRIVDDRELVAVPLTLPGDLPLGYHHLEARTAAGTTTSTVIVTPRFLGLPAAIADAQTWGFAAQLYSVRSQQSWGVGDLGDLTDLAVWSTADLGAGYLLVNPLHAAEPVAPLNPSPYLPSSRRFFNPIYLRVEDVPEYATAPTHQRAEVDAIAAAVRAELADVDAIDRDRSWSAKREALRALHRLPRRPGREIDYRAYRERHGDALHQFATWSALAIENGNDAREWADELAKPDSPAVAEFAERNSEEIDFQMWLQWLLDEQLQNAQGKATVAGMPIGIMHDLAVGVHPGGADAWRLGDAYASGIRVGAPPDAFNQIGQDWQQPPWRPDRLAELGYAPFRDLIRNVLRHAGGVRIDHIIGLFRLWWVPEGRSPAEGTYVRYDHEAMIGVLALEASRAGAVVVGEDLGVVEDSARAYLLERGILGTSILWFERDEDGAPLPAEKWRELCLASTTTHDLPPNASYLEGGHVDLRNELGLLTRPVDEEKAAAESERESWLDELRSRDLLTADASVEDTVAALHRYLTLSPSRLLGVALTDAIGDRRTQNQPGTENEYPNWRIPLSDPDGHAILLEEVITSPRVAALAATLQKQPENPLNQRKATQMDIDDRSSTAYEGVPELEEDETVAPRPEEEIADIARSAPDVEDHAGEDATPKAAN